MSDGMIALGDMKSMSEAEVKYHIADKYAGSISGFDYGKPSDKEKAELSAKLEFFDVLVAYESVGLDGCDSSSWFLLRNKAKASLHTISGSHCSCYGFEGQGEIEDADIEYLKSDRFHFPNGGYDESADENEKTVKSFLSALQTEGGTNDQT